MRHELVDFFARRDRQGLATLQVALPVGPQTVVDLGCGQKGVIVSIRRDEAVSRQLVDKGLGRGALIEVEGVAPMGDPIRVRVRRYRLALRRTEAAAIVVVGR